MNITRSEIKEYNMSKKKKKKRKNKEVKLIPRSINKEVIMFPYFRKNEPVGEIKNLNTTISGLFEGLFTRKINNEK